MEDKQDQMNEKMNKENTEIRERLAVIESKLDIKR
jgi:hypothetical protein